MLLPKKEKETNVELGTTYDINKNLVKKYEHELTKEELTEKEKMVDEFTAGAVALEIGEYSKTPVESQFGYHIILVEDKQAEVNLLEEGEKYSEVLSGIYRYGLDNLAASLMENAEVEVLIDKTVVPEYPKAEETQNDGNQAEESAE